MADWNQFTTSQFTYSASTYTESIGFTLTISYAFVRVACQSDSTTHEAGGQAAMNYTLELHDISTGTNTGPESVTAYATGSQTCSGLNGYISDMVGPSSSTTSFGVAYDFTLTQGQVYTVTVGLVCYGSAWTTTASGDTYTMANDVCTFNSGGYFEFSGLSYSPA
jgi:hypothetical protein